MRKVEKEIKVEIEEEVIIRKTGKELIKALADEDGMIRNDVGYELIMGFNHSREVNNLIKERKNAGQGSL